MKSKKHPGRCLYECRLPATDVVEKRASKCGKTLSSNTSKQNTNIKGMNVASTTQSVSTIALISETDSQLTSIDEMDIECSPAPEQDAISSNTSFNKCNFKSNYATEFRDHLDKFHRDEFSTAAEVS